MSVLAAGVLTAVLLVGQIHADPKITGAVVNEHGVSVADAEVVFTAGPALDGTVPILERATTDASGRFRLIRPPAEVLHGFTAAGSVWVIKPGCGLAFADLVRGDRPGQIHRLVLEPASTRKLTLRDAAGKPVPGAGWRRGSLRRNRPASGGLPSLTFGSTASRRLPTPMASPA